MDWAGWNQAVGTRSTHGWTSSCPSFLSWQQYNLPNTFHITQSRAHSPSFGLTFSPQFAGPLLVFTGTYIIRDLVRVSLATWVSDSCLYEPLTPTKHILRLYKGNIIQRRPRYDLNSFPLAKSLKIEDFFPQNDIFSSVRKRKIKETIQWTIMKSSLVQSQ